LLLCSAGVALSEAATAIGASGLTSATAHLSDTVYVP
jgi:hypothetical protein